MSGLKYDSGKAQMSMLDWTALEQVARVLEYGAKKYTQDEVCTCGAATAEYTKSKNQCVEAVVSRATPNGDTRPTPRFESAARGGLVTGTAATREPGIMNGSAAGPGRLPGKAMPSGPSGFKLESTSFLSNSLWTSTDKAASTAGPTGNSSSQLTDDSQILDSGVEHASHCGSGRNNWRKGMRWSRLADAALRHLLKWVSGSRVDEESGLSHLAHAMCCLMFLLNYEQTGLGEDDVRF